MTRLQGGVDEDAILGAACGAAVAIGAGAAAFVTGGLSLAVGGIIAGPACAAAGAGAALN